MKTLNTERLNYLDSIRGLLAISVLIFHVNDYVYYSILNVETQNFLLETKIIFVLNLLFNGHNAVMFFFVHSGFILTYAYVQKIEISGIYNYSKNRVFRIFPLYIFSVLFACTFYVRDHITLGDFLLNISIFSQRYDYVPPGWSMYIELIGSFILPFVWILWIDMKKNKNKSYTLVILIVSTIGIMLLLFGSKILAFPLGYGVYIFWKKRDTPSTSALFLMLLTGIVLFTARAFESLLEINKELLNLVSATGSALLLYCLLELKQLQKVLNKRVFVIIGELSFGIYLLHWTILYNKYFEFKYFIDFGLVPTYLLINIAVILITGIISYFTYNFVEKPFIKLGKNFKV